MAWDSAILKSGTEGEGSSLVTASPNVQLCYQMLGLIADLIFNQLESQNGASILNWLFREELHLMALTLSSLACSFTRSAGLQCSGVLISSALYSWSERDTGSATFGFIHLTPAARWQLRWVSPLGIRIHLPLKWIGASWVLHKMERKAPSLFVSRCVSMLISGQSSERSRL